jgi:hypothetical protein
MATIALVALLTATASANTSHHSSDSSGGGSDCIRWEPIDSADLGDTDGGAARDLGDPGVSSDPHAGMQCVERASLFGCSVARPGGGGSGLAAILIFFALTFDLRRRRRRARG